MIANSNKIFFPTGQSSSSDSNNLTDSVTEMNCERSLIQCYKQMFQEEETKDFKFSVGDKCVMVHKLILTNRCDYFKKMLQYNTVEKAKNEVIIDDFNLETMESFVQYLYTNEIECIELLAEDLLILADKYFMHQLKEKCEQHLISTIEFADKTIDLLIFADKYNCESLEEEALSDIRQNICAIRRSDDWQKLHEFPILKDRIIDELIDVIDELRGESDISW